MRAVYDLLLACGSLMLVQLAAEKPIRGGIDVGTGMDLDRKLFSAAMVKAYELEIKNPGMQGTPAVWWGTAYRPNALSRKRNVGAICVAMKTGSSWPAPGRIVSVDLAPARMRAS